MTLVVQFAMQGEARPFLARRRLLELSPDPSFGFRFYQEGPLVVAVAGLHPRFGVDAIGTVPAALLTHATLTRFAPSRVISAGTAGGFEARGGRVGQVYLGAETAVFHDRRIALPNFQEMGQGHFPVECDRALATRLGLEVGIVSTGDSLDCTPEDLRQLIALGASVKEMEAAAVAWVCERHAVPLVLLKAITDIVDHPGSTASQFLENYDLAVTCLSEKLDSVVNHYLGCTGLPQKPNV
jgi:5'-methylthioadenosine nucleosidase